MFTSTKGISGMKIDMDIAFKASFNKDEVDVICYVLNLVDEYLMCEPEDREGMISERLENWSGPSFRAILNEVATEFANPPSQWD